MILPLLVDPSEAGQKLLRFLERRLGKAVPRSALMRWIRTGQVRVDGCRAKPFVLLTAGQSVRVPPHRPGESPPLAANNTVQEVCPPPLRIAIVFESEELLVVAKPTGLPTHAGTGWNDSLNARVAKLYPQALFTPVPAHRLDRDTSGLILFAKTHGRLVGLHRAFLEGLVRKTYLAWVQGEWDLPQEWTLRDTLAKSGAAGRERVSVGAGKAALARVKLLGREKDRSLVAVALMTGRTHQIRVQLASRGFPILGDFKYGQGAAALSPCLMLHAAQLALPDHSFVLPPPWDEPFRVDAATMALLEAWSARAL